MKQKVISILLLLSGLTLVSCSPEFWAGFANGAAMGASSFYSPYYSPTYTPTYSFSGSSTSQTTTSTPELEKTLKTESDGFSWYKIEQGGKIGAQTAGGSTIIPLGDYLFLYYRAEKELPSGGYFKISCPSGDHDGAFSKTGTLIIPLSREYTSVYFINKPGHVGYFCVKKNGKEGVCDVDGKEIIVPQYESIIFTDKDGFKYKDSQGKWQSLGYTLDANGRGVRKSTPAPAVASTTQERMDLLFVNCLDIVKDEQLSIGPNTAPIEYICRFEFGVNTIKVSAVKVERGNGNKESSLYTVTFTPSLCTYTKEGDKITIEEEKSEGGANLMVIVPSKNMIGIQSTYYDFPYNGFGFIKMNDDAYERLSTINEYTTLKRPALDEHSRLSSKINKVVTKVNSYKFKNR